MTSPTKLAFYERHPWLAANLAIVWGIVVLVVLVVLATVGVLIWSATAGKKSLDIEGQNFRHSYGYQQNLRDTVNNQLPQYNDPSTSPGQRTSLRTQICGEIGEMDGTMPSNIVTFNEEHCL